MNKIFHFQKFKIMQLVIEKKFSSLKAALFSASDFFKQKILVGSEIYLKKSIHSDLISKLIKIVGWDLHR